MSKHPYYYVEGVAAVSHSEGVFRVIFGQREGEREHTEEVCLYIPASQYGNILQTLATAAREIGTKIQENRENVED